MFLTTHNGFWVIFLYFYPSRKISTLSNVLYSYFLLNIISSTQIYLPFYALKNIFIFFSVFPMYHSLINFIIKYWKMIRLTDVTFVQVHVQDASLGKMSPLTVFSTATQISLSYLLLSLDLHSFDAMSPSSLPPKAFSVNTH